MDTVLCLTKRTGNSIGHISLLIVIVDIYVYHLRIYLRTSHLIAKIVELVKSICPSSLVPISTDCRVGSNARLSYFVELTDTVVRKLPMRAGFPVALDSSQIWT